MRRPVTIIALGVAFVVLGVLAAYPASAERLEVLRDGSSGRMFAIRVSPEPPDAGAITGAPTAESLLLASDAVLVAHSDLIGLENPLRDLEASQPETDKLGFSRVRYQQRHQGLEVLGGEVTVHMNRAGQVTYVKAKVARELPSITIPVISEDAAHELAVRTAAGAFVEELTVLRSCLLILSLGIIRNEADENTHLAWEVEVVDAATGGNRFAAGYYVDAMSGALVFQATRIYALYIQVFDCAAEGGSRIQINGHDYDPPCGRTIPMGCEWEVDTQSPLFPPHVFGRSQGKPARGSYPDPNPIPYHPYYGFSDIDSLYVLAEAIHNYYLDSFGINGANGQGGTGGGVLNPGITRVWGNPDGGTCVTGICPGGGAFFSPGGAISLCLGNVIPDSFGHEYSHAVVYFSFPGGASYYGQTGALNEGTSDFMGEVFEYARTGIMDWKDRTTPLFPPLRDLANPESMMDPYHGLPFPARFHSPNYYCGSSDQGGVHHNSTVFSHGMYLVSEGGEMNGCTIEAQGMDVAQQILFRGWRSYFSASETFNEAYADLIQASNDLYPPEVTTQVTAALQAVEMDQPGLCSGIPEQPAPCNPTGGVSEEVSTLFMSRAMPNPASGSVRISYQVSQADRVTVDIHDAAGRLVRRLLDAEVLAGPQAITWDCRDSEGNRVGSGIYFYRVQVGGKTYPGRIIAVR